MSEELKVNVFPIEKVEEYLAAKKDAWKSWVPKIDKLIYDGISNALLNNSNSITVEIDVVRQQEEKENQSKALDYVIREYRKNRYKITVNEDMYKFKLTISVQVDREEPEHIIPRPDFISNI